MTLRGGGGGLHGFEKKQHKEQNYAISNQYLYANSKKRDGIYF